MALYVGETVLITHTAEFDGAPITAGQVTGVFLTIYRGTDEVLAEREMTWSEEKARWQYDWDTSDHDPALEAGSFRIKIRIAGSDGSKAHEYKTIRLNRNPV